MASAAQGRMALRVFGVWIIVGKINLGEKKAGSWEGVGQEERNPRLRVRQENCKVDEAGLGMKCVLDGEFRWRVLGEGGMNLEILTSMISQTNMDS